MQYCIYLRKSRADIDTESYGDDDTLARHERTLIELAKRQKLHIVEIYKEVVSGETISARPVMQRLLTDVENDLYDGVLVMEIERLARGDTIDQGIMAQTFKYSNTKIITPMKTYDPNNEFDEEYFEFGLFMSRREYKTINRRLQRGRLSSVKEGKYVSNSPPYGYVRKKLDYDKGFTLEPHIEESEVIKLIFELYVSGENQTNGVNNRIGVSRICSKLNSLKIKPRRAESWTPSSVRDILINPVYNGKIRWNWRPATKKMNAGKVKIERPRSSIENCIIVKGLHKAIIDDETWDSAQAFMKQNPAHPAPSQYQVKNPLSGIVFCGKCGRRMLRRPHSKAPDTLMCPLTSCANISSKLDIVESHILKSLEKWLEEYKNNWDSKDNATEEQSNFQIDIKKKALKKLNEEVKTLETQMSNLHDLLEQGIYSTEKFLDRTKFLSEKINFTQQEIISLNSEILFSLNKTEAQKSIIPKVKKTLETYYSTNSPKLKNDLLKEILEKVVYTKSVNTRWHNNPNDFQIDLFPKIPK